MPDAADFVNIMKKAAIGAVEAKDPVNLLYGTVKNGSPLKILVDQRFELGETQLLLCRNVTNYNVPVLLNWNTQDTAHSHTSGECSIQENIHSHEISGIKEITIQNGLAAGDEVILIRQQGGQKYIVLDKVGR